MKVLSLVLVMFLTNCGFATIKDAIYKFSDALQSYKVAGVEAKIDGNLVTATVPDDVSLKGLAPEFVTNNAYLYVDGERQISGKSIQDFSKDIKYQAISFNGNKMTYIVRVHKAEDTVVEKYSNVIKVKSINDDSVNVFIERSPEPALLGINANNIEYCVNVSVTNPNIMLYANNELKYVEDIVCLDTYSYEDLPTEFNFVDDKEVMINYVAIYNGVKFVYNRLYIQDDMEFFTGTCEDLFNPDNYNSSVVLTQDLDCCSVDEAYAISDLYFNGNGYTIYNMYGAIQSLNMSYITNVNFSNVDGLAKEISFSMIENLSFSDTNMFRDGNAGYVAGVMSDTTINNLDINANIYSSGDNNGLIAGKIINNFMFPITISRVKLNGLVNGSDLVGGAVGFLISYTKFKDIIVDVDVAGTGEHVGCFSGANIDEPELINIQELCE